MATANHPFSEWGETFSYPSLAAAVVDPGPNPARFSTTAAPSPTPHGIIGATVYGYYANAASVTNPCPGGGSANQGGRLQTTTSPSPDGTANGRRATTVVYDAAGRVVASHVGSEGDTCTTYDVRGRITALTIPAYTNTGVTPDVTEPARAVAYVQRWGTT